MVCSNCGHPLGPDDQYCPGCGAFLTDAPDDEYGEYGEEPPAGSTPDDAGEQDGWVIPYASAQPSPPRSGPSAGMIGAAVGAVALVAVLAFWVLRPDGEEPGATDPAPTAAPTTATAGATDATTDAASASPTDTSTDAPTESPTEPPPATPVDLPGSAEQCNNIGSFVVYRGNTTTSCPFAENVGRAFAELEQPVTTEVTLSGVSSPVTGLDYDLTCEYTIPVRCTGGNNAAVYLAPAS
jgi:hypothetical protein